MKPFLTVENSRHKRTHIVFKNNLGDFESLCKTTDAGEGPRGKELLHSPHLHSHVPSGYSLCRTCLLRAYDSDLIDVEFAFERTLVETQRNLFRERPLTMVEYEERERNKKEKEEGL